MFAGELPVPVIRLIANIHSNGGTKSVTFPGLTNKSTMGFTLPENVGDLGPDITALDLSACNLAGATQTRNLY